MVSNLELDGSHGSSHWEDVSLPHWTVSFGKVWLQEHIEQVSKQRRLFKAPKLTQ